MARRRGSHPSGQTMVELALIFPLFAMVLVGIIVLGIGVFYQQQITNAAREAARWAGIHSATASCPTVGSLDPDSTDSESGYSGAYAAFVPLNYTPTLSATCYRDWEPMISWARSRIFGLDRNAVEVAACWSSYWDAAHTSFDAPPPGTYPIVGTIASTHKQCTIDGVDPTTSPETIGCSASLPTDDTGSAMSEGPAIIIANTVTAYACYRWSPPLAGFLLIPSEVVLRGVITEPIQRQQ